MRSRGFKADNAIRLIFSLHALRWRWTLDKEPFGSWDPGCRFSIVGRSGNTHDRETLSEPDSETCLKERFPAIASLFELLLLASPHYVETAAADSSGN